MEQSGTSFLRSRRFHTLVGFVVSAALLGWMFLTIDWSGVGKELERFQWWALVPCVALLFLHFYLRALRWRYLLPGTQQVSLTHLFDSIIIGCLATFLLPLRAGEIIRPFMLTRYSRYSFSTGFVSVVVERFFDLAVVLGFFALVAWMIPSMPEWVHAGAVVLSTIALGIFVLMSVATLFPGIIRGIAAKVLGFLPVKIGAPLGKFLDEFLEGAAVLRHGGRLVATIVLSLLIWGSCFLQFWAYFWLFGEQGDLLVAVTVAVIIALAVAAPSAPGFIGVYQVATIAGFQLFGLSEQLAVAYSIVNHLLQYVFFVVYGMVVLSRAGVNLSQLRDQSLRMPSAAA